jgi:hypothetical protein
LELRETARSVCSVTNNVNPETLDAEGGKVLSYQGHVRKSQARKLEETRQKTEPGQKKTGQIRPVYWFDS